MAKVKCDHCEEKSKYLVCYNHTSSFTCENHFNDPYYKKLISSNKFREVWDLHAKVITITGHEHPEFKVPLNYQLKCGCWYKPNEEFGYFSGCTDPIHKDFSL